MNVTLATLDEVKGWFPVPPTNADPILNALNQRASGVIMGILCRPNLLRQTVTERYSGTNGVSLMLRQWPVLSVASVKVGGVAIPVSTDDTKAGWYLEPWDGNIPGRRQMLTLRRGIYLFCRGSFNVEVIYDCGYSLINEAATIPATPFQVNALSPQGTWAQDDGVTFANGTALQKVTANPITGQYAVAKGQYTFAAADAGKAVLISYSYIPGPLVQACAETVAERFQYRQRIGQSSQTVGSQETASYSLKDLQDYIRMALQPYRAIAPL